MRISDWSSDVCSSDLDRLTGILGGEAHDPAAPILVLPNAGMVPRAGLFRLHVEMSRRLGVRTFRFDLPGVGEAPRILGCDHQQATRSALDHLDRKSTRLNSSH